MIEWIKGVIAAFQALPFNEQAQWVAMLLLLALIALKGKRR